MQGHTEQRLDKLAEKVVKSTRKETPSFDFTARVMSKIEATQISHITVYKPLISKKTWVALAVIILGGLGYMMFSGDLQGLGLLENVDLSTLTNNKLTDAISGIKFSKTLIYAAGLGGLLFFVQIPLMKYYLNKRLETNL